jgi:predicted outer membrane repeat protein/parallel beta-helix repeat protein
VVSVLRGVCREKGDPEMSDTSNYSLTRAVRAALAALLLTAAVVAVPAPARAVTTEYWISDQATAAAVGSGTSCDEPDFRYTGADGGMLNDALGAVIANISTSDSTIYLCNDGSTIENYVMDADTAAPNDMNAGGTTAAEVTIIGVNFANSPTASSLTFIDGVGLYSPFDFTDANVTISNLVIANAFDDSDGGAVHIIDDSSTETLTLTLDNVDIIDADVSCLGSGAGVNVAGDVIVSESYFGSNDACGSGGAIYASGDVTITESNFDGNSASLGGAIYTDGSLFITDSGFGEDGVRGDDPNTADAKGGVAWVGGSQLTVIDSTFGYNYAIDHGGVFYVTETIVQISGSTFIGNYSDDESGGVIEAVQDGEQITVSNSTFIGNNAYSGDGGALSSNGGDIVVTNSTFTNNDSRYGAVTVDDGSVSVNRVTMTQNDASEEGGAIWSGGDVTVLSSRFIDNYADDNGGAIYLEEGIATITTSVFDGNVAGSEGGGIYLDDCESSKVSRNTFVENDADSGGAINDDCNDDAVVTLESNTFTRNTSEDYGAALDHDSDSLLIFRSNRFTSNAVSDGEGGALWINYAKFYKNRFESNSATDCGGAVYVSSSDFNTLARGGNVFKRNTGGGSARDRQVCFNR